MCIRDRDGEEGDAEEVGRGLEWGDCEAWDEARHDEQETMVVEELLNPVSRQADGCWMSWGLTTQTAQTGRLVLKDRSGVALGAVQAEAPITQQLSSFELGHTSLGKQTTVNTPGVIGRFHKPVDLAAGFRLSIHPTSCLTWQTRRHVL